MWELDYKEGWVPKNWCFWIVVLEKILESPLDCKEIQPVHPKGNQSWIIIERTDAGAETPILWPPDVKNWLIGKDSDAGKDWGKEEKGMTEDEMLGLHHWLNVYEFKQASGVGDGQWSLVCCSPWGHKESDTTEQLNLTDWTEQLSSLERNLSQSQPWTKASSNISTCRSHMFMPKIPAELKSLWCTITSLCPYFTSSGHWDDRYSYVVLDSAMDIQTFKKEFSCLGKIPDEISGMACKFRVSLAKIRLCWWLRL